jgi:hypothetical protein
VPASRRAPLHDGVDTAQRNGRIVEQPPQDPRAGREREAGDHRERLARERRPGSVSIHGVHRVVVAKTLAQLRYESSVELHGNDAGTGAAKRAGDDPGAGAEVQHEIARPDAGAAGELVGERAATKCVPPARR